ncbi:Serine/threonine-protein kinase OXI1 [Glycine soja]|nr:Serine/threonine-protein kinase OXI1 [Glycine soja]
MGTVFLVQDTTNTPFALKVVDKTCVHAKLDAERRARWEIQVLSTLSHPFLIRFYVAEILCALQHLHSMNIAYRDLKPENVLVQNTGHITLTDFDLSRKLNPKPKPNPNPVIVPSIPLPNSNVPQPRRKHRRNLSRWISFFPPDGTNKAKSARVSPVSRRKPSFSNGERSNSFVGTEEYVSPEVVRGDGHEFAVDWWALGILIYEMLYGKTPFKGRNRKETFRNVIMKPPEFVGKRTALTNLIERLLEKDPTKRLGYTRGAAEIKEHEFFRGVRWELLTEVVRPPFIPSGDSGDDGAGEMTERFSDRNCGVNIRDYFQNLKSSPSGRFEKNVSLREF